MIKTLKMPTENATEMPSIPAALFLLKLNRMQLRSSAVQNGKKADSDIDCCLLAGRQCACVAWPAEKKITELVSQRDLRSTEVWGDCSACVYGFSTAQFNNGGPHFNRVCPRKPELYVEMLALFSSYQGIFSIAGGSV